MSHSASSRKLVGTLTLLGFLVSQVGLGANEDAPDGRLNPRILSRVLTRVTTPGEALDRFARDALARESFKSDQIEALVRLIHQSPPRYSPCKDSDAVCMSAFLDGGREALIQLDTVSPTVTNVLLNGKSLQIDPGRATVKDLEASLSRALSARTSLLDWLEPRANAEPLTLFGLAFFTLVTVGTIAVVGDDFTDSRTHPYFYRWRIGGKFCCELADRFIRGGGLEGIRNETMSCMTDLGAIFGGSSPVDVKVARNLPTLQKLNSGGNPVRARFVALRDSRLYQEAREVTIEEVAHEAFGVSRSCAENSFTGEIAGWRYKDYRNEPGCVEAWKKVRPQAEIATSYLGAYARCLSIADAASFARRQESLQQLVDSKRQKYTEAEKALEQAKARDPAPIR